MKTSVNINFVNQCLSNTTWSNEDAYQVEGLLKGSNQYYKFDIRHLSDFPQDKIGKLIDAKSNSDKILFEDDNNWILVDTQELIKYMKEHGLKEVKLEELLSKIEWNIILSKK